MCGAGGELGLRILGWGGGTRRGWDGKYRLVKERWVADKSGIIPEWAGFNYASQHHTFTPHSPNRDEHAGFFHVQTQTRPDSK